MYVHVALLVRVLLGHVLSARVAGLHEAQSASNAVQCSAQPAAAPVSTAQGNRAPAAQGLVQGRGSGGRLIGQHGGCRGVFLSPGPGRLGGLVGSGTGSGTGRTGRDMFRGLPSVLVRSSAID